MGAKMPEEFKISVLAVYPNETGGGEVRFSFERPISSESVELDVPYLGDEGMDAGEASWNIGNTGLWEGTVMVERLGAASVSGAGSE